MTEAEWLAATDPTPMLQVLGKLPRSRKVTLLVFHAIQQDDPYVRRYPAPLFLRFNGTDLWEPLQRAIAAFAEFADGQIDRDALDSFSEVWDAAKEAAANANDFALAAYFRDCQYSISEREPPPAGQCFRDLYCEHGMAEGAFPKESQASVRVERQTRNAALLREIFGNPFRPVTFSPDWRTTTAVALAAQMYDSRDFSAMPILADALQDAGCENSDILAHCRDEGQVHVRGCWVVDGVLGKE